MILKLISTHKDGEPIHSYYECERLTQHIDEDDNIAVRIFKDDGKFEDITFKDEPFQTLRSAYLMENGNTIDVLYDEHREARRRGSYAKTFSGPELELIADNGIKVVD